MDSTEGRALESRDIEQVKRAYPGLTAAQQDSWQRFFDRVRNLRASLSISGISVAGVTAELLMENFKVSHGSAELTTPAVPPQHTFS